MSMRRPAAYVETHRWQVAHIRKGPREAELGKFVAGSGVKKVIARLRRNDMRTLRNVPARQWLVAPSVPKCPAAACEIPADRRWRKQLG